MVFFLFACDSIIGTGRSPSGTNTASGARVASGAREAACGSFDHPIDSLQPPSVGEGQIAEGSGCGSGTVPADGSTFTVDASALWILNFAYTCNGTYQSLGDTAIVFTAHNTGTGTDSPPVAQPGPWGYGSSGLTSSSPDAPPPGTYVIRVTVANPDTHKCFWDAAVVRRG